MHIFGLGEGDDDGEGAELGVGVGGHLQVLGSGTLKSGQRTARHIFGFGHLQVFESRTEPSGQRDWMQMTGGQAHVIESLNVPSGQTEPPSQIAAPAGLGDGLADRRSIWSSFFFIVRDLSCQIFFFGCVCVFFFFWGRERCEIKQRGRRKREGLT